MFNTKEDGFSLIELIIVIIIAAILAQIGFVSFIRLNRKAKAFAARTALLNIKKECEANRDLGLEEKFTLANPNQYSIKSREINSCLGM